MKPRYKMTFFGNILVSFLFVFVIFVCSGWMNHIPVFPDFKTKSLSDTTFKIYFPTNSAGITTNQTAVIKRIVTNIQQLEALEKIDWNTQKIYIVGNASKKNKDYSSEALAHELAESRAYSVALYLYSNGIPKENVIIKDNGNLNPANYSNADVADIMIREVYSKE